MSTYNFFYNGLIFVAFLFASVAFFFGYKRFGILSLLLLITSIVEITVLILLKKRIDFTWIYHLYNLVEYTLLILFLRPVIKSKEVFNILTLSIPIFLIIGFSISLFFYHFKNFPGININIEGLLLFLICAYILFTLEVIEHKSILTNPNLWICSGVLIFFGCTFLFNGVYTYIVDLDEIKGMRLFSMINRPLNIILYLFIIIGILCLPIRKRPIIL